MSALLKAVSPFLIALGFLAGGGYLLVQQHTGEPVDVVVTRCVGSPRHHSCTGEWENANGVVVSGPVEGAIPGDIGKPAQAARLHDGRAHLVNTWIPITCLGIGLVIPIWMMIRWAWRLTR